MDIKQFNCNPTVCIKDHIDDPRLRRRFQINVLHLGRGILSKPKLQEEIARKFKIIDTQNIFIFGFCTYDQRSSSFGLIYDKVEDAIKYEPKCRLLKNGIHDPKEKSIQSSVKRPKKIYGVMLRKK